MRLSAFPSHLDPYPQDRDAVGRPRKFDKALEKAQDPESWLISKHAACHRKNHKVLAISAGVKDSLDQMQKTFIHTMRTLVLHPEKGRKLAPVTRIIPNLRDLSRGRRFKHRNPRILSGTALAQSPQRPRI
jgi:hypothetical protein